MKAVTPAAATMRKAGWLLVPFLVISSIVAFIDRVANEGLLTAS